jgi:hypothetical protein
MPEVDETTIEPRRFFVGQLPETGRYVWGRTLHRKTDGSEFICDLYPWESNAAEGQRIFTFKAEHMTDFSFYDDAEQVGIALIELVRSLPNKGNQNDSAKQS